MASNRTVSRLNPNALASLRLRPTGPHAIGRRGFIIGATTAIAAAGPMAKALNSTAGLGGFRLRTRKGRGGKLDKVTIELHRGCAWCLDATLFEGNPILDVVQDAKTLTIRLQGARFPGTLFNLNLEAKISTGLAGHTLTLRFWDTGVRGTEFKAKVPLAEWLRGEAIADARLNEDQMACLLDSPGFFQHAGLKAEAPGVIRYEPSGRIAAVGAVALLTEGESLDLNALALLAKPRSAETIISGKSRSCTLVDAQASGSWDHAFALKTAEGWHVNGQTSGFEQLVYEAHESGSNALVLLGTGALQVEAPGHLAFDVEETQYARLYGEQQDVMFAANLADGGVWIHQPGLSVEVGPREGQPFVARVNRQGALTGSPALEARRVAPTLDDAVVSVRSHEPQPLELLLTDAPQVTAVKPQTKPIQIAPAIQKVAAAPQAVSARPIGIIMRLFYSVDTVRPKDLLNLTFEFANLKVVSQGTGAVLTREDATKPTYVVVGFPPQSIAEETFEESLGSSQTSLPPGFKAPVQTMLANPSKLVFFIPTTVDSIKFTLSDAGGLLDWSNWNLAVSPTAISTYGPNITVDPNWKHPIQISDQVNPMIDRLQAAPNLLLERIPAGAREKIQTLLSYRAVEQKASAVSQVKPQILSIAPNINPVKFVRRIPQGREILNPYETAIEMPAWLRISPDEDAKFFHSLPGETTVENKISRSVLWHTRLGTGATVNGTRTVVEASDDGKWYYTIDGAGRQGPFASAAALHASLRAVDSFDWYKGNDATSAPTGPIVPNPAMMVSDRKQLVDNMTFRTASAKTDSSPFVVERLMLTPLGGYLKGSWDYNPGTEPLGPTKSGPTLIGWKHIATLGRDHYVKIATRGFLYPSMHQAVMITISERKFQTTSDGKYYAVLRKRKFVIVTQPTVTFAGQSARELGFQSLTCLTKQTPNLSGVPSEDPLKSPFWMKAGGKTVTMTMKAVDMDNVIVTWDQPSGFIPFHTGLQDIGGLPDPKSLGVAEASIVGGQKVSLAPAKPADPAATKQKPSGVQFPTEKIFLGSAANPSNPPLGIPAFRPVLSKASIRVSALEQFQSGAGGQVQMASLDPSSFGSEEEWAYAVASEAAAGSDESLGPVDVKFAGPYLASGFGNGNPSEVLFELINTQTAKFGDVSKSGGVVNPNMNVGAISRKIGPMAKVPTNGQLSPADYRPGPEDKLLLASTDEYGSYDINDSLNAKILGAVSIWDIIPSPIDLGGDGEHAPKFILKKIYKGEGDDSSSGGSSGGGGSSGPSVNEDSAASNLPEHKEVIGLSAGIEWTPKLDNWPSDKPVFVGKDFDKSSADPKPFAGLTDKDYVDDKKKPDAQSTLKLSATVTYIFKKSQSDSSGDSGGSGGGSGGSSGPSVDDAGSGPLAIPEPSVALDTPDSGFKFELLGGLYWFRVDAVAPWLSVVYVDVQRIEFKLESGKNLEFHVDIPRISFTGPLKFVQKIEDFLGGSNNSVHFPSGSDNSNSGGGSLLASTDPNALTYFDGFGIKPFFSLDASGVTVGFVISVPDITIGVFAMRNITLTAKVTLPFIGDSFTVEFDFCTRDHPFALSVWGITGGGYFGIAISARGLKFIEAALEFGASISLDIGVASGSVSIMAGIYFKLEMDSSGNETTTLTGYVRLNGDLSILGIITLSLEFYLGLTWTHSSAGNKVEGDAMLKVEITILFFSIGVTLSVHKEFAGGGSSSLFAGIDGALPDPTANAIPFTMAVSEPQWDAYCEAFGDN